MLKATDMGGDCGAWHFAADGWVAGAPWVRFRVRGEVVGVRSEVVGVRREEGGRRGTACRALGEERGCLVAWLCFSPGASRVSPRRASYASPKKSNQKKGEPRPCRFAVPCATRSVRDTCKLASLEISTPLNRLRRFPLQGTTPAARQSRLRGVPGRGFASLASH